MVRCNSSNGRINFFNGWKSVILLLDIPELAHFYPVTKPPVIETWTAYYYKKYYIILNENFHSSVGNER